MFITRKKFNRLEEQVEELTAIVRIAVGPKRFDEIKKENFQLNDELASAGLDYLFDEPETPKVDTPPASSPESIMAPVQPIESKPVVVNKIEVKDENAAENIAKALGKEATKPVQSELPLKSKKTMPDMHKKNIKKRRENVRRDWRAGKSIGELVVEYQVSETSIKRYIKGARRAPAAKKING